jgi:hypothetical protein
VRADTLAEARSALTVAGLRLGLVTGVVDRTCNNIGAPRVLAVHNGWPGPGGENSMVVRRVGSATGVHGRLRLDFAAGRGQLRPLLPYRRPVARIHRGRGGRPVVAAQHRGDSARQLAVRAVAATLGVLLLHEPFTVGIAVGFVLVLTGSVLATRKPGSGPCPDRRPRRAQP